MDNIYTQFRFGGYDFHKVYKINFAEYIRRKSLSRTITQVIYRKYLILTSFDNMLCRPSDFCIVLVLWV